MNDGCCSGGWLLVAAVVEVAVVGTEGLGMPLPPLLDLGWDLGVESGWL